MMDMNGSESNESFAVFIRAYPDGEKQSRSNKFECKNDQARFWCPKHEWYLNRLAHMNSLTGAASSASVIDPFLVSHFAIVKCGIVRENYLTLLKEEEMWGWEFFQYPADYFCLHVEHVFPLQEPFRASEATAFKHVRNIQGYVSQNGDGRIINSTKTLPFQLHVPQLDIATCKVRVGHESKTISEMLQSFHLHDVSPRNCVVIPVVKPVLDLLNHSLWPCIPCLGRWLNVLALLPPFKQAQVREPGFVPPTAASGSICSARLRSLIVQIQSWAPLVLQNCDAEDHFHFQSQLEDSVRWLFDVKAALQHPAPSEVLRNKKVFSSLFLVKCMLSFRNLPSSHDMTKLCTDILELLYPDLLGKSLEQLLQSKHLIPAATTKHKMRLFLDAALFLWRRERERTSSFVRFGGADSSPQLGLNSLMSSSLY